MHEHFDHTADLGLRATSPDMATLFAEMACCLTAAMIDRPETIEEAEAVTVELADGDRDFLLFDWLRAILHLFEDRRFLGRRFEVTIDGNQLKAAIWGEPADAERHPLSHEVKAVTYHGLKVEQTADGWLAEAIVDI